MLARMRSGLTHANGMATIAVVTALAVSACGDGDGLVDRDLDDREEIVEVITVGATSTDPEKCALNTQRALEQQSGLEGERAIKVCESFAAEGNATSVKVSEVSVQGSDARAVVAVTGSELDGQTVTLRLVKEDGDWKLDLPTGFVSFDRSAWNAAMDGVFRELGLSPPIRDCAISQLARLTDDEVQELYVRGEPERLGHLIGKCGPGGG